MYGIFTIHGWYGIDDVDGCFSMPVFFSAIPNGFTLGSQNVEKKVIFCHGDP